MSEQITAERRAKVLDLFHAIDSKDIDSLLSFMAPDVTQRFGNQEPLGGHDEIRARHEEFFSTYTVSHEITGLWEWDDTVVVQINASYERTDGLEVTVPAVSIIREADGQIVEYEVFVDMAPLFAPAST
jgi:ketosteroid isomerase-like protein